MYDVVSIGEGMLRLIPPRYQRLRRAHSLDVEICGSQGNIACNIARLGLKAAFCTKVPDSQLGLLMRDHYMSCGVDPAHIQMIPGSRLGVNYLEFGATPRASSVVYDRKNSAASTIAPGDFNWDEILNGCRLAYTDGILPGLSDSCAAAALDFIDAAKRHKCMIGFDVNYRENLWTPDKACQVQSEIIRDVDILMTSEFTSQLVFGYSGSCEDICKRFHNDFGCKYVAITLREVHDVLRGALSAVVYHDGEFFYGRRYEIDLVDRFGSGDAWDSGFMWGILTHGGDTQYAADFGDAMCALQHTMPGDVAQVTVEEVEALMKSGDGTNFEVKR